jgi:hypothetical protein
MCRLKQYWYSITWWKDWWSDCITSNSRSFERWSDTSAFMQKFESAKWLYHFKSRNFLRWSDISTYGICQKIWIVKVSLQTPEFFLDEVIQVLLRKKFETTKLLYRFKPQKLLAMKRYNYFYYYFYLKRLYERRSSVGEGGEGIHRFHLALKGQ